MRFLKLKFIFVSFFISFLFIYNANASKKVPFDNIVIHKQPLSYEKIIFEDFNGRVINLKDYKAKIYVLNFWATWCSPCKEEMPSLDQLNKIKEIKVFPINIDKKNQKKTKKFFDDLNIESLSIFFDSKSNLPNLFKLRGIPTTLILNSESKEFARVIGSINFSDPKFINWILSIEN